MSLQFISDKVGNKTAVIIPIEEWNQMKEKHPDIEPFEDDIPLWQQELVLSRRKLINDPGELMLVDDFLREMEQEADEEI